MEQLFGDTSSQKMDAETQTNTDKTQEILEIVKQKIDGLKQNLEKLAITLTD